MLKNNCFCGFCPYSESQWDPKMVWRPVTFIECIKTVEIFFKISSFMKFDVRLQ